MDRIYPNCGNTLIHKGGKTGVASRLCLSALRVTHFIFERVAPEILTATRENGMW